MGGATTEEPGVLKLVHPGRVVQIHKQPLLAAEVMKKNPRHCVTRPDVFKYPWIVVKPESVLATGKVFFIVPNVTIYRLLKERDSPPPQHNSNAGTTPKHQSHRPQESDIDYSGDCSFGSEPRAKVDGDIELDSIEEIRRLNFWFRKPEKDIVYKSCIRKPDSDRPSLNLRVSFLLSINNDNRQRRLPKRRLHTT